MGDVLSCDCAKDDSLRNIQQTTPEYESHLNSPTNDGNNIKLRKSLTKEAESTFRKMESGSRNDNPFMRSVERPRFKTECHQRREQLDQSTSDMQSRDNTRRTLIDVSMDTPAQSNRLKRLRTQKFQNQKTMTRSSVSKKSQFSKNSNSDFADDHELVHNIFEELKIDKLNKNYKGIARSLVGLVDLLRDMTLRRDEYSDYDASQLDKAKTQAFKQICQTIQEMTSKSQDLFQFAFELRKIDTDNKYSGPIFGQNVKSDALIKLICSNNWNSKNLKMVTNDDFKFKIQTVAKAKNGNCKTLLIRKKFGPNLQVPMIDDKQSLMLCDTVSFEIKKLGTVLIVCNGSRLACQQIVGGLNSDDSFVQDDDDEEQSPPYMHKSVVWVKNTHPLFSSEQATEWTLTSTLTKGHAGANSNQFYIEIAQEDDDEASNSGLQMYRLVYNRKTSELEVVNKLTSPLYDDQSQSNKWSLVYMGQ